MEIGEKLKDFELPDYEGNQVSSYDLINEYALLVLFIASDCELSRAYVARVCKLINRYEEDDLGILLIDLKPDKEGFVEMQRCLQEYNLNLKHPDIRFLFDSGHSLSEQFPIEVTPTAFLFNQHRELVYRGPIDDAGENPTIITRVYLEDAIENVLDGLEVDFPEVEPYGTPVKKLK
ncbi:MAG: redoxin domain-containing protein [Bacteroidia bacterium]